MHAPLLRRLENWQKFSGIANILERTGGGQKDSRQKMMDLSSLDRGGQGTKQNMYRGPLIKHDAVIQGLAVFIACQ